MSNLIEQTEGFRIKTVGQLTGLTTHVIRKWEERYQLLNPARGANGYRLYFEDDLQLLMYIRWQISNGQTIGHLANLGADHLRQAMKQEAIDLHTLPPEFQPSALTIINAARQLDRSTTESSIHALVNQLGVEECLYRILFPVLRTIGDLWHQGQISMTGEHLVTQAIRHHLLRALRQDTNAHGPVAILACAPGNFHEIGAISAALLLKNNGWNPMYLGTNSDLDLLRLACQRRQGKLVILSIVVEQSEKEFIKMVKQIKKKLLNLAPVIIGGRGASHFASQLEEHGIMYIEQLHQLQSWKSSYLPGNQENDQPYTKYQKEFTQ